MAQVHTDFAAVDPLDAQQTAGVTDPFTPTGEPMGLDIAPAVGLDPMGPQVGQMPSLEQQGTANPMWQQFTTGSLQSKGSSPFRDRLIAMGQQYAGKVPYVWGGSSPSGFDCSGLVQYLYGKLGVNLPRISYQQANYGTRTSIKGLRPGDLVAWDENSRNAGADHIAIYIGHGKILEAPHAGANVRVRDLGKNEGAWGVSLNLPGDH